MSGVLRLELPALLLLELAVPPLDGHLVAPEAVAVEGGEAVDHDGDGEDQGEDGQDRAHRTHELSGRGVRFLHTCGKKGKMLRKWQKGNRYCFRGCSTHHCRPW